MVQVDLAHSKGAGPHLQPRLAVDNKLGPHTPILGGRDYDRSNHDAESMHGLTGEGRDLAIQETCEGQ